MTSGAMGFGHVLYVVAFITTLTSGLRPEEQGIAGTHLPDAAVRRRDRRRGSGRHRARSAVLAPTTTDALATLGGLHAVALTAGAVCLLAVLVAAALLRRAVPRQAAA
ncbi:hypothetical protein MXD60_25390 [Frankia sp. AgB32]|nr:hypothetical protein [Frankia sp. AgB32]